MSPEDLDRINDEFKLRRLLVAGPYPKDEVRKRLREVEQENDRLRRQGSLDVRRARGAYLDAEQEKARRTARDAARMAGAKVGWWSGGTVTLGGAWEVYCQLDDRDLIPKALPDLPDVAWALAAAGVGLFLVAFVVYLWEGK